LLNILSKKSMKNLSKMLIWCEKHCYQTEIGILALLANVRQYFSLQKILTGNTKSITISTLTQSKSVFSCKNKVPNKCKLSI
jgi:hypothetical protein